MSVNNGCEKARALAALGWTVLAVLATFLVVRSWSGDAACAKACGASRVLGHVWEYDRGERYCLCAAEEPSGVRLVVARP